MNTPSVRGHGGRSTLLTVLGVLGALSLGLEAGAGPSKVIPVPAGSVDALAGAIAAAGPGGTVVLESGFHHESDTVVVEGTVNLIGRDGAVLSSTTVGATGIPLVVRPALHFRKANGSRLLNLDLRPAAPNATCGVLLTGSDHVEVGLNEITGFQVGILIQRSNRLRLHGNVVETDPLTEDAVNAGIVVLNGTGIRLKNNYAANAFAGIFCSGEAGWAMHNVLEGNFIGILLGNATNFYLLPGDAAPAVVTPATRWALYRNEASANTWGYLVIDGAKANYLVNNHAWDNGFYDLELAGDTERFGSFAPTSANNVVVQGRRYAGLLVKDCGENNTVHGHVDGVDPSVDPCF